MSKGIGVRDLAYDVIKEHLRHRDEDLLGLCGCVLAECTSAELCRIAAKDQGHIEWLIGEAKALKKSVQ